MSGIRGNAARIFTGKLADTVRHEQLVSLMQEFAEHRNEGAEMAWLQEEHPNLYTWLSEVPPATLAAGRSDPTKLVGAATQLASKVDNLMQSVRWDDVGLSPKYESLARRLYPKADWQFIQDLDNGRGQVAPRFVMEGDAWRPLIPGQDNAIERMVDWSMKNDLHDHLARVGVERPDVRTAEFGNWWARLSTTHLHVPPEDAALLMDGKVLGERASRLDVPKGWSFARREMRDGQPKNICAIPAASALGMRGVSYELADTSPEGIRERCIERLTQRGVDKPDVRVETVEGRATLLLPTDQARVLVAPIAVGDPASQYSFKRPTFDPAAKGYDAETGVFLTQAAKLAYEDDATIRTYIKAWGFEDSTFVEDKHTDAQGFVAYDEQTNSLLVSFRGTESRADVNVDSRMGLVDCLRHGGRAHSGFYEQFDALLPKLQPVVEKYAEQAKAAGKEPPSILAAGHSLGGALAAHFAGWAAQEGLPVRQVYTCGQPKIGDETFAGSLGRLLKSVSCNFFRYINNNDVVARVPPNCTHEGCGTEVYINSDGKIEKPGGIIDLAKRRADRFNGLVKNWVSGHGIDAVDYVSDHRVAFYLGFVRKNRDLRFDA
ncbi:MAG: lipase family protein [Deltaproteobacteria bacterium]|jgi:triacylglycerol lipase